MPINKAESNVKIYACRNATRTSRQSINITNNTDTGASTSEPNINIRDIRLRLTKWPATIFANNLIISANGFVNKPIISTGIIIGNSQNGTPGVAKTCLQYILLPLNCITINVQAARTNVTAILPVTMAPNGGGVGISPIKLLIRIKKNTVRRYGMYFSNLCPRFGMAI